MIWPEAPWFGWACSGALGLLIGSFLNVVVWRMPRGESIVWPGSHCPSCAHPLSAQENLPILSWLALRARCRWCGTSISARYPLVEGLTGLLFAGAFGLVGWGWALPFLWAFLALGVVIAGIDWDTQLVFDLHTFPGIALGLVYSTWVVPQLGSAVAAILYALAALAFLWGLSWLLLGEEGIGSGDFLLVAMLGAWLGLSGLGVALGLAFALGALQGTCSVMVEEAKLGRWQPLAAGAGSALMLGMMGWWALGHQGSHVVILVALVAVLGGSSLGYAVARQQAGPEAERPRLPFGPALIAGGVLSLFAQGPVLAWFWSVVGG